MLTTPVAVPAAVAALTIPQRMVLSTTRKNLYKALAHPVFTKAQRQAAATLIEQTTDAVLLAKWQQAACRKGDRWDQQQAGQAA